MVRLQDRSSADVEIERKTRAATSPRLSGQTPAHTHNDVPKDLTSGTKISKISEDLGATTLHRVCPTEVRGLKLLVYEALSYKCMRP